MMVVAVVVVIALGGGMTGKGRVDQTTSRPPNAIHHLMMLPLLVIMMIKVTQDIFLTQNGNGFCFHPCGTKFSSFLTLTFQLHPHVEAFLESGITRLVSRQFFKDQMMIILVMNISMKIIISYHDDDDDDDDNDDDDNFLS